MARVVLDANVLVSACFGGIPAQAVSKALKEEVWVSDEIIIEIEGLSERLATKLSPARYLVWKTRFLPLLLGLNRVKVRKHLNICRDPKDDAYLSLAKSVKADYLVTGDSDLLDIKQAVLRKVGLDSLTIATPRKFLKLISR